MEKAHIRLGAEVGADERQQMRQRTCAGTMSEDSAICSSLESGLESMVVVGRAWTLPTVSLRSLHSSVDVYVHNLHSTISRGEERANRVEGASSVC